MEQETKQRKMIFSEKLEIASHEGPQLNRIEEKAGERRNCNFDNQAQTYT